MDDTPWSGPVFPLIKQAYTNNIFLDLAALLIPMTYVLEFNLIGRLYAIELLLLALLPRPDIVQMVHGRGGEGGASTQIIWIGIS